MWLKTKTRDVLFSIMLFYFTSLLSMIIFGGAREQLLPAPLCLPSHSTQYPCRIFSMQRPHSTSVSNILVGKVIFNTKRVLATTTWVGLTDWFWSSLSFEWHLLRLIHGPFFPICTFKHQNQVWLSSHQQIYGNRTKKTWNSGKWKLSGGLATCIFSVPVYPKYLHKQIIIIFHVE